MVTKSIITLIRYSFRCTNLKRSLMTIKDVEIFNKSIKLDAYTLLLVITFTPLLFS